MPAPRRGGGPDLPYRLIAGVEPCPAGWLVVASRLQGITAFPTEPEVFATFADLLDCRPAYDVLAVHCHLSFPTEDTPGGRLCDREARELLGWPRAGAITSPPSRMLLRTGDLHQPARKGLSPISAQMLTRYAEVAAEMQPYRQRQVFEVHPELSFYQLNDDQPMQHPKESPEGVAERRTLVEQRIPGIDSVLEAQLPGVELRHLLDASADMVTARRISARAVERLPADEPEWDAEGVRMEILR